MKFLFLITGTRKSDFTANLIVTNNLPGNRNYPEFY